MIDEQYAASTAAPIDAAEYKCLTERLDRLWESASSANKQREMRKLLTLIDRYEAAQQHGRDAAQQFAPASSDVHDFSIPSDEARRPWQA